MTIRVTVKNEEAVGGRMLSVYSVTRPRDKADRESFEGHIRPGESREYHIHAAKHLVIDEWTPDT